jgi:hypothetical protein
MASAYRSVATQWKAYLGAYRSNDLQPGPKIIIFDYQAL